MAGSSIGLHRGELGVAGVLAHNRDEETEHAAMSLEWLRRNDPALDAHLRPGGVAAKLAPPQGEYPATASSSVRPPRAAR